ncbi:MAG: bifunctional phosphoribosylaminoimidazolecarboxamide formyltransferase/IMP cyclohydrolase [Alphaproteobacteria bacterium]|nr:bifunctional phosphoribosylaminoimidazolecarboxamide formyltransferase/IMP cyclohydrolase [Alphaproteobacteria bacterium]
MRGNPMSEPRLRPVRRALISVSDKAGLIPFAQALARHNVTLISTGGTAKALTDAGIAVEDVASVTKFPELLDGRLKTLHPAIHGGILAKRDERTHMDAVAKHGIAPIDLVAVNLYPFAATVARGAPFDECVENIDIGGPSLIRAAAKNHADVVVVTDAADYQTIIRELDAHKGATTLTLRRNLAQRAFARTAAYDAEIAWWLAREAGDEFPEALILAAARKQTLRYGENPHQHAAFYVGGAARKGVATARQLQGKELSYNNLNDTDAAFELAAEFAEPAVVIVKHGNPCGVAVGNNLRAAWEKALATDPTSAFGGIVAVNRPLDASTAEAIGQLFMEVVIAPAVEDAALAALKKKNALRVLAAGGMPDAAEAGITLKSVAGGYLLQTRDGGRVSENQLKTVTKRAPSRQEIADLVFAFRVCKHVKSNAIVFAKGGATVGVGAGQMSRVDSVRVATQKGGGAIKGSVIASDAFFPFADGLETAIAAGATAAIQPGGSVRDAEVIAAADKAGIAMVFTGMRHFRH